LEFGIGFLLVDKDDAPYVVALLAEIVLVGWQIGYADDLTRMSGKSCDQFHCEGSAMYVGKEEEKKKRSLRNRIWFGESERWTLNILLESLL
jgi:hypothetical protein